MNPIDWIRLRVEAMRFGINKGQEYARLNPLMSEKETKIRLIIEWADHLDATNRSNLIKDRELINKAKEAISNLDEKRNQAIMQECGPFIN